jgi:hypothetical protein
MNEAMALLHSMERSKEVNASFAMAGRTRGVDMMRRCGFKQHKHSHEISR